MIPLAEQDRSLRHAASIDEGLALITRTLAQGPVGPCQIQAAIAAVHSEAAHAGDTDWKQIVALYDLLQRTSPNPAVALNHAVAVAMAPGPQVGLELLDQLATDVRIAGHHRFYAVRAHLLEMAGETATAQQYYRRAARRTTSLPERRYLESRAARLVGPGNAG